MSDSIPEKLLKMYSRDFPKAWRLINSMRGDRGKALDWWPDWCYCPIAGTVAIITNGSPRMGPREMAKMEIHPPAVMAALAAWRVTKGIYRFDETLLREITAMPLAGDLPSEIFYQLPEWCLYIETPNMAYLGEEAAGVFVSLEYDPNDYRHELRLVFVSPDLGCRTVAVHLGKWTVLEAMRRYFQEGNRIIEERGLPKIEDELLMAKETVLSITAFVNLVLYICSVNADFREGVRPQHPQKLPRRKGKIQASQEVKEWEVGIRLGPALRKALAAAAPSDEAIGITRTSPRPHVRRAHWHHFWTGPQDIPDERILVLRWLSPILVNIPEDDVHHPVVLHPVKDD